MQVRDEKMSSTKDDDGDVDIALKNIVNDKKNPLSKKDQEMLRRLYKEVSTDIRVAINNQNMDDLDFAFWLDILSIAMTVVENLAGDGKTKKHLVVEIVALVLEQELPVEDNEQKEKIVQSFRKIAPKAIDVIVFMSKKLNLEKLASKCFPCCF